MSIVFVVIVNMKPIIVADEMFPEGPGPFMDLEEAGGSSGLLMDLAANEKDVHADFYNGIVAFRGLIR
uniref:COP9 signalosome complex subunit 9 n=1 Tax=Anopheles dirus TaxID=7168 RepID=A0A182NP66_9DIPT